MSYPLPSDTWVKKHAVTSDLEIAAARNFDFVLPEDERFGGLVHIAGDSAYSSLENKGKNAPLQLRTKYFVLLIVYLFEVWFLIDSPKKALEYLVIDFFDLDLAGGYDGILRSRIAGIAEIGEPKAPNSHDWKIKVLMHRWLADYVLEYLKESCLDRAVL